MPLPRPPVKPQLSGLTRFAWVSLGAPGCRGLLEHDGAPKRKLESLAEELDWNKEPPNLDMEDLALYRVGN